jgi:hypothetical protein
MFRRKSQQTTQPEPTSPQPKIRQKTDFPSGLAIQTERGLYFIKGKTRFKFFSERVFSTWSLSSVEAEFSAIRHFQPGTSYLGFRDGTLINNVANGRIYLISGNKRRHIVDPDVFEKYGLDPDAVVLVSDEEANLHQDGEVLK